jgi:hypothetical protein
MPSLNRTLIYPFLGKHIMWHGFFPPQAILRNKKFKKIILNPPNFNPGSWCGAGKFWIDMKNKRVLVN